MQTPPAPFASGDAQADTERPRDCAAYLQKILNARVYEVARQSDLQFAPRLSAQLGNSIFFKREDQQSVFSFKLRGAYNKMAHLPREVLARGVVTA